MRLSLRKSDILRGYKVFSRVIAEGHMLHRGVVRCFVLHPTTAEHAVCTGFSVSRSIRNAADRNRARRWMKESYRKNRSLLTPDSHGASAPVMVVFLCTASARSIHNASARASIEQSTIALLNDIRPLCVGKQ